ncbi:MAG: MFS transporter [Lachnospiraceae bacterium]|nr:MFS transporter [Lachnospiraceae bacterium]
MGKNRKEKTDPGKKLGFGKICVWQSRQISQSANLMVMGYLTIFCTDILGLPVLLVGTLLLASRLIDGVTDIVAGYIVDRTKTKLGRGRPYELSIVGLWVCTVLMFSCPPGWDVPVKCAYVLAMYAFINSVFATFLNAANTPYMVRAFNDQDTYVKLTSFGGLITMLAVVAVNVTLPLLMSKYGTTAAGWRTMILIYAIPMATIGILRFLFIPEKYDVDATTEKINFHHVFQVLKDNPYIYIVALIQFVMNLVSAMGIGQYYYTYIVKDISLMSIASLVAVVGVVIMPFLPTLLKKVSIKTLIIIGFFVQAFGCIICWFANANFPLLLIGGILVGAGAVPANMLSGLMIIDCADYNEWKGQPRMEATLGVIPGLAQKLASAFGAFLLGVFLSIGGYISGTADGALVEQPDSAILMLRLLQSFIPMAFYLVAAFVTRFYKLDKLMPQIRRENAERRAMMEQKAESAAE